MAAHWAHSPSSLPSFPVPSRCRIECPHRKIESPEVCIRRRFPASAETEGGLRAVDLCSGTLSLPFSDSRCFSAPEGFWFCYAGLEGKFVIQCIFNKFFIYFILFWKMLFCISSLTSQYSLLTHLSTQSPFGYTH